MNVDTNIKLSDNKCYIGPADENALPIINDELTMTKYDPYMREFKDEIYVQNLALDNRYYLGTVTYNLDLIHCSQFEQICLILIHHIMMRMWLMQHIYQSINKI